MAATTPDAEARCITANEIAALLRAQYVASGDRAYLHAAEIAMSRTTREGHRPVAAHV